MTEEKQKRLQLIEVCKRMYNKGFINATDGNVSIKLSENEVLFTPSGVCKGFLESDELIITNLDGQIIHGNGKPTTEIFMHLESYKERKEIKSVVHAHPPVTVAFTYANLDLSKYALPEVIVTLGEIPTAPYALTGTKKLAEIIGSYIRNHDAVVLEKHGVITVGKDVFDAYYKLEKVEHTAQVAYTAIQLGSFKPLSGEQIEELKKLRETTTNENNSKLLEAWHKNYKIY